ncbi:MAG: CDP-alcohol phosphatidyltransferase family protein [Pirellulales bacterium]|nr:CDP-alcohol phosphatidyltransferase family protein [Pirellulales bacterium]
MTANQATAFGIVFVLLTSASFYVGLSVEGWRWLLLLTPVFLVFRMAMNALDGMLAREYNTGTVAGELFNEGLDVIGDTVCYSSLFFVPGGPNLTLTLLLLLAWMAEFFGVLGKGLPGGVRRHETFLGGKPDRAVWMSVLAVLLFIRPAFLEYVPYYLLVMSFFVFMTSVLRIRKTLKVSRDEKYESYTWIGR